LCSAQVVLLVADAQQAAGPGARGLARKDLALASKIVGEGRALLILLNKLDALPQAAAARVRPTFLHAAC
jgi:predicted GTPase